MNKYRKIFLPVIVLLQLAILGSMIAKQEYILKSGSNVLLLCEPIDPRSLFSGDYVKLNYQISRITDLSGIKLKPGENVSSVKEGMIYLALDKLPDDRFWKASAISTDIEWLRRDFKTIIRGRVSPGGIASGIKFGLEDYFVPQNEGRIIENDLNRVSVEVSVLPDGSSAISRLFINEKEVRFY